MQLLKAGSFAITPEKAYETYDDPEEDTRRFVLKFTAAGPMWNSTVAIDFPAELDALDAEPKSSIWRQQPAA